MIRSLAVVIFVLGLTSGAQATTLSTDKFTQVFAKALQSAQPTITVTIQGELALTLTDAEGKETNAFLDNAYRQYLLDPNAIDTVVKTYVSSYSEGMIKVPIIDRTRIVPIIKDRKWLLEIRESVKQRGNTQVPDNVLEDFNDELVIIYAEDTPKNINYFSPNALEELGISRSRLRSIAIANLRKLLPKPELHTGPLFSMITAGGNYESSLLLFDDLWASLPKTDGEIVVAIPARDLLVFTRSRNQQGIVRLREYAAQFVRESSYGLTDALFVYRNGHFVRFE